MRTVGMTLKEYLKSEGRGALTALAKKLGTSKGYLSDIALEKATPSPSFAKRIQAETGVPATILLGLEAA